MTDAPQQGNEPPRADPADTSDEPLITGSVAPVLTPETIAAFIAASTDEALATWVEANMSTPTQPIDEAQASDLVATTPYLVGALNDPHVKARITELYTGSTAPPPLNTPDGPEQPASPPPVQAAPKPPLMLHTLVKYNVLPTLETVLLSLYISNVEPPHALAEMIVDGYKAHEYLNRLAIALRAYEEIYGAIKRVYA